MASRREEYKALIGREKAAVLLLALGEEQSAKLFKYFDEEEIKELSQAMALLGQVDSGVVEKLFIEFAENIYTGGAVIGSFENTERMLLKILPRERVNNIMEEIRGPAGRTMWDKLSNVKEDTLASYLKNEYPQTIAVVLSRIKPEHASKVLSLFPEALSMEVVMRMLRMETVQKEVLDDVEKTLRLEFMTTLSRGSKKDPHELLAEIFNNFDRQTEERLLTSLEERSSDSAEKIRALMFTFEDLRRLDASGIQTLIRNVDKTKLALALKGAPEDLKDVFFGNMSERAAKLMKEDIAGLGMVRLKDVDEAQQKVVQTAKELAAKGEIFISDGSPEDEMI